MKQIKAAIVSVSGTTLTDDEKYLLACENPLGVAFFMRNISTPHQLWKLTKSIKEVVERDNILLAVDQEGGRVCRLAPPYFRKYLAQAAIGKLDFDLAQEVARLHAELIAHDLHKVGFNCNFAPTLDVATSLITNALKSRCFSKNPLVVAALSKIIIDTYQCSGILSCIKHVPGHSGAENDPHLQLSKIRKTYKRFLYPFEQIAPSALMAMTAHIVLSEIDDVPITMSSKAIRQLIRGQFNFKGILLSDALEMKSLPGSLTEKTLTTRAAGVDAVCYCKGDYDGVKEVLNNCGYLDDTALTVLEKISSLILCPYTPPQISGKARRYQNIVKQTPPIIEDYDAVEVLNQL